MPGVHGQTQSALGPLNKGDHRGVELLPKRAGTRQGPGGHRASPRELRQQNAEGTRRQSPSSLPESQ